MFRDVVLKSQAQVCVFQIQDSRSHLLQAFQVKLLKTESGMNMRLAVVFKGSNYLVWSRMVRTTIGSKGLWGHITFGEAPKSITQGGDSKEVSNEAVEKWQQEDIMVMYVLHVSLNPAILEVYSHCETAKELWDTLKKVYGKTSNLSRIFEVKQAINCLVHNKYDKVNGNCDHCKNHGNKKSQCRILHPHLKPAKFMKARRQEKMCLKD